MSKGSIENAVNSIAFATFNSKPWFCAYLTGSFGTIIINGQFVGGQFLLTAYSLCLQRVEM